MQEDLTLPNHLSGLRKKYLQLLFDSTRDMMSVRKTILPAVHKNRAKRDATAAYADEAGPSHKRADGWLDSIEDIREYDVPFHHRVAIDTERRCGKWYTVREEGGRTSINECAERQVHATLHATLHATPPATSRTPGLRRASPQPQPQPQPQP